MDLIAKAKPVKIRIKVGGEEHASLDSLKRKFNIFDILPLLDGRLVRWLKQQGENDLAEKMVSFDVSQLNDVQCVMNLIEPFFSEYIERHSICDVLVLLEHWLKSSSYRENGEYLFYYIMNVFCFNDEEGKYLDLVKYLYKKKSELKCPVLNWYLLLSTYKREEENDPEVLYFVGKMLWDGYQFNDLYIDDHFKEDDRGLILIQESARLGNQEANLFIFNYNLGKDRDTRRFAGVNRKKLKNWIDRNWKLSNPAPLKYYPTDYTNNKEKTILDFICQCDHLVKICARLPKNLRYQKAIYYFGKTNGDDALKKEKWFIVGLFKRKTGLVAIEEFKKASDYPPAEYMLSRKILINNIKLKEMTFSEQISFVIRHLFDYE